MNELTDNDIREALRRREARRVKPEVPSDFCDNVMQEIGGTEKRHTKRVWSWRWTAVAACLIIIIGIGVQHQSFNQSCPNDKLTTVDYQTDHGRLSNRPRSIIQSTTVDHPIDHGQSSNRPRSINKLTTVNHPIDHGRLNNSPRSIDQSSATDSLDYYINKIERELASVDDSLYIERIHRVMHADERLQRIVNSYIVNELHRDAKSSEANHINNVTTDDYEE